MLLCKSFKTLRGRHVDQPPAVPSICWLIQLIHCRIIRDSQTVEKYSIHLESFDWQLISVVGGECWECRRQYCGGLAVLPLTYDCFSCIHKLLSFLSIIFSSCFQFMKQLELICYSCGLWNYFRISKGDRLFNEWVVGELDFLLCWLRIWSQTYFEWDIGRLTSMTLWILLWFYLFFFLFFQSSFTYFLTDSCLVHLGIKLSRDFVLSGCIVSLCVYIVSVTTKWEF